ncbi:MAG: OmpA family protein [Bacteroidota bacterium]
MEDKSIMGKLLLPTLFLALACWLFGGTWWYTNQYYPGYSNAQASNQIREGAPTTIRPSNIYFQGKEYEIQLTDQLNTYLISLKSYLAAFPDAELLIIGHTDNTGSEENNLSLSKNRAENVQRLLLKLGIKKNQIIMQHRGSENPIAANTSEEGRAKNRRVEIRIRQ